MNISEALQDKNNCLRLSNGDRWLCGNGDGCWVVYERKPYSRQTKTIIETSSEHVAILVLLQNDCE